MAVNFSGKWHNQHCSEMELTIGPNGSLTGIYSTGVGAPTPAEHFPLVGFVADDQISFTVNFGSYGSLTAWVGQLTADAAGNEFLETFWHLTENVADPPHCLPLEQGNLDSGAETAGRHRGNQGLPRWEDLDHDDFAARRLRI
jgi:hypothetical protein